MNHDKRKYASWIAAAVLFTLLIVAGVILLATGNGGTSSQEASSPAAHAQGCPASTASGTIPIAPPSDLAWKYAGAVVAPTSATAGPARYDGPVWECYAHTPMGAVMASYDIVATLASPGWHTVATQEIAPGPGQRSFISASEGQTYQPLQPDEVAQPVGFQVVTYSPQQATIETLAADGANGEYQADERTVEWVDGDWKLVMNSAGEIGPDPQILTSAQGFVLWGGGSDG